MFETSFQVEKFLEFGVKKISGSFMNTDGYVTVHKCSFKYSAYMHLTDACAAVELP